MTRFFWLKDTNTLNTENNIQMYRVCRVPFGVISSPFLLATTLEFHLKTYKSTTAEQVRDSFYVDNVTTGIKSTQEAIQFYRDSKEIFAKAGMNLRDWASNDAAVLDEISFSDRSLGHEIKVLGLTWTMKDDQLSINHTNFDQTWDLTKRAVLKQIASVYEPLGLFSPVTLQGKLFLQKLWIKKLDWDESLSCQDKTEWNKIRKELEKLTAYFRDTLD